MHPYFEKLVLDSTSISTNFWQCLQFSDIDFAFKVLNFNAHSVHPTFKKDIS